MSAKAAAPLRARGELLDVRGASRYLGITERHLRRLIAEKRIPYLKIGGDDRSKARIRLDTARIENWLAEHSVEPESD